MFMTVLAPITMDSSPPTFYHFILFFLCYSFAVVCLCFDLGLVKGRILVTPMSDLMGSSEGGVWPLYRVIFATRQCS